MVTDARAFVLEHTAPGRAPMIPEIELRLATEPTPLWEATQAWLDARGVEPPFWAFAWAGGQALARFVLDGGADVRGMVVVDLGAGGGIVGIAAGLRGAARVLCVDRDPIARAAASLNAERAGVLIETAEEMPERCDVLLAGDVFYDKAVAAMATGALDRTTALGGRGWVGDPGRPYLPDGLIEVAVFEVPVPPALESRERMRTRVLAWPVRARRDHS
jgi:predicted nicotinamide N-methyase